MVTIEHTSPEVGLPTKAPTRGHIATLLQCVGSSRKQVGMRVGRDLVGGIETIEMGDVTVFITGIVGIDEPLLQLTIAANLHGRKLGKG